MIEIAEALEIVLAHAQTLPGQAVALSSHALGRILAEDVTADIDSPPFTKALMDGYAVRTADTSGGPVELEVIEEIQAGARPSKEVGVRQPAAIYTGAPMPDGADAVAIKERCERLSDARVKVDDAKLMPGKNVLLRGGEMHAGEAVLPAGTAITPATLGLLAAVGRVSAKVHGVPAVGILATGDELVAADNLPLDSQIRNTNGPMLCALAAGAGATPHDFGIARDVETPLMVAVAAALERCDVLLLAGGVSAGKFDLVPGVLEACGVTAHFHKVRMKPGKPLLFGTVGGKLVFGLPGNPVSAFVCFELFVRPALRTLAGHPQPVPEPWELPMAEALSAQHDRPTFHPARIAGGKVHPLPWRGSAELRGLFNAQAFLELPPGPVSLHPGDLVRVRPFG